VILEAQGPERVEKTARRIVAALSDEELAKIAADWLDAQIAI
jgi:hypothetical protein